MKLVHNWTIKADPFYAMHKRTGYALEKVVALTPAEAVSAVFGDAVAGLVVKSGAVDAATKVQGVMFAAWCYMQLRQAKRLVMPLAVGEAFCFPQPSSRTLLTLTGYELIASIGQETTANMGAAYKQLGEVIGTGAKADMAMSAIAQSYGLNKAHAKQALLAAFVAQTSGVKTLTFATCEQLITDKIGHVENLVFVDHNWLRWGDFHWTAADVAVVVDWLAGALKTMVSEPIKAERLEDGSFGIWMDDAYEFVVTAKDGVFETSRNRRFNSMLLLPGASGRADDVLVPGADLSLINSYGTFVYGLLYLGAKYLTAATPELAQFVTKTLTSGNDLPMTSDDEVGAPDGDRIYYERYVTVSRIAPVELPFKFNRVWVGDTVQCKVSYNSVVALNGTGDQVDDEEGVVIKGAELPNKSAVDRAALLEFNLVRMPRGQFIDGRRSCIQVRHIDESERAAFVLKSMHGVSKGDVLGYARKQFGLDGTDEQVMGALTNHLIIGLSSKAAKLIKRTAMDAALVGELVNGEERGFKRFGQPEQSANNWLVEAVVSPHAINAAGMALYWGEAPTLIVKHTETCDPMIPAEAVSQGLKGVVNLLYSGATLRQEFGWYVAEYAQPVQLDKGEVVCTVPYTVGELALEHNVLTSVPDAQLVEVRWRYGKTNGNGKSFQIKVTTQTLEHELKGRNNVKCMLSRYPDTVINNGLNGELAARSVFYADTNKWLDLVMQAVDVAACTAIKNGDAEGLGLIAAANAAAGVEANCLVWSPVLATMGVYEPLMQWFEAKFGRAVWFSYPDQSGEFVAVLRRMYTNVDGQPVKGWAVAEGMSAVVPDGAENVLALADGAVEDPHTNVLVFFTLDGVEYFLQRAWSYAGDASTGAVWQPVKAELSSVRAVVGQTPLMAGVARYLEQQDREYAQRLVEDGFHNQHKAAALYAMSHNSTLQMDGVELPIYMLGSEATEQLLRTDEFRSLVTDPGNAGQLLKVLTQKLSNVVFSICAGVRGHFSVYLPALCLQDSATGFKSSGGLSELVTTLFAEYILGGDVTSDRFHNLAGRAKGALSKLVESKRLAKAPAYCRKGVQAKSKALIGVPVSEMWVLESVRSNSVYQMMCRTYGVRDVDGRKVIMSRAPMTTPSVMKVKVIRAHEALAEFIEADTITLSPLGQMLNGGDNDGDNDAIVDAEDSALAVTTLDDIITNFVARTGSDQLEPGANYWGDHYQVVSYAKIQKKREISDKNYSLDTGHDLRTDRTSLPVMLQASTQVFQESVGWFHRLFIGTDIYLSLAWNQALMSNVQDYQKPGFATNKSLVLIQAENYEVPLGGLDWGAFDVGFGTLIPVVKDHQRFSPDYVEGTFRGHLEDAGMNASAAKDIYGAAVMVSECRSFSNDNGPDLLPLVRGINNGEAFLKLATETSVLVSKGQFLPRPGSRHAKMVEAMQTWLDENDPNGNLCQTSIVLKALDSYLTIMLPAYQGEVPALQSRYFV